MQKRLLVQTQLSNYDRNGKFILEADSGWQMTINRVREMLKLNNDLSIDIMGPTGEQLVTRWSDVNVDLWRKHGKDGDGRLRYVEHRVIPNALVTRYDFDWASLATRLNLGAHKDGHAKRWDAVYINDPMHLRAFRAMFYIAGGYTPRFYVHSHFVDLPEDPKFPVEASLWLGQCEAAIKADHNFWQCESAMTQAFDSMRKLFEAHVVDDLVSRSTAWDDGYSETEMSAPIDESVLRFDIASLRALKAAGNVILFVPNRVGGRGRSSDYTNCGHFIFECLPLLWERRDDFVVIAGNPSQKFSNDELAATCPAVLNLVPDALRRDEYRAIASIADIVVGLYTHDTYGGTAARECVTRGCVPLWTDCFEYSSLAREARWPYFLVNADLSDLLDRTFDMIVAVKDERRGQGHLRTARADLVKCIKARASFEATTPAAMSVMGLL